MADDTLIDGRLTASMEALTGRNPPPTFVKGRRCEARGCTTVLSMYNGQDRCWRHAPVRAYNPAKTGRRPKAAPDPSRLMDATLIRAVGGR